MKNIAYIEIDTHAEIAQAFIDIMKDSQEFKVDYYFSKKIKDQVREEGETVFLSDSSMISDQLKAKNYDLIIIGTVHRYFNTFLTIVQKYNTAVITHNLNFPQSSKFSLIKSIFKEDLIYRIKLWWKEGLFYSSKVYKQSRSLLVLDNELCVGKYQFLPLFYTSYFGTGTQDNIVIVIPGGVSQKRRDYNYIFKTIQELTTDEKFTFVFLGKAQDKELKILDKLAGNLPENITVNYFKERVSSDDYDLWMEKADVLWCPIQQQTEFFSQKEIYGKTKMTGNLGDAIKYGKWAVFPKNYPSQLEFIIPEEEDIIKQFQQLKTQNFDFQKNYGKKNIQEKLGELLDRLI
ncbi:hypothetical protein CEY12_19765 [Chryseobacterium sp. T16E-39]|uniref:hypothetical protein n=1 Tax=Chryseobacterium sp. T16E-39 TaxID=2015076 RepID=UPI000B5B3757|nr:hypothetical protein [Chryseobacterium sp. T16E-39]ASK32186.1 hypothetical protein CEY12_19765 [Chryseobacterium sp. T16E-39]